MPCSNAPHHPTHSAYTFADDGLLSAGASCVVSSRSSDSDCSSASVAPLCAPRLTVTDAAFSILRPLLSEVSILSITALLLHVCNSRGDVAGSHLFISTEGKLPLAESQRSTLASATSLLFFEANLCIALKSVLPKPVRQLL